MIINKTNFGIKLQFHWSQLGVCYNQRVWETAEDITNEAIHHLIEHTILFVQIFAPVTSYQSFQNEP